MAKRNSKGRFVKGGGGGRKRRSGGRSTSRAGTRRKKTYTVRALDIGAGAVMAEQMGLGAAAKTIMSNRTAAGAETALKQVVDASKKNMVNVFLIGLGYGLARGALAGSSRTVKLPGLPVRLGA